MPKFSSGSKYYDEGKVEKVISVKHNNIFERSRWKNLRPESITRN